MNSVGYRINAGKMRKTPVNNPTISNVILKKPYYDVLM